MTRTFFAAVLIAATFSIPVAAQTTTCTVYQFRSGGTLYRTECCTTTNPDGSSTTTCGPAQSASLKATVQAESAPMPSQLDLLVRLGRLVFGR